MRFQAKQIVGIAALVTFIVIRVAAQVAPIRMGTGGQWLTWTPDQRNTYVAGMVDGYTIGTLRACEATEDLFEVGQPHRLGDDKHPSEMPSARCMAATEKYSRCVLKCLYDTVDCSAYTGVITEF